MLKKLLMYKLSHERGQKKHLKSINQAKTNVCRLCLASNVTMVGIFDCVNRNLAEDIQFCTGILIQKTVHQPQKICSICLLQLKTAFMFKNKCILTEKKLNNISSNVKTKSDTRQVKNLLPKQQQNKKQENLLKAKVIQEKTKTCHLQKQEKATVKRKENIFYSKPQENRDNTFLSVQEIQEKAISIAEKQEKAVSIAGKQEKAPSIVDKQEKAASLAVEESLENRLFDVKIEFERDEDGIGMSEERNNGNEDEYFNSEPSDSVKTYSTLENILNNAFNPSIYCKACNVSFATTAAKEKHMRAQHYSLKNRDLIPEIQIKLNDIKSKRKQNEQIMCICEICGVQLPSKIRLWVHLKSHQPPNYFCAHCDYKTNSRPDLIKHLMLHADKRYQCGYCAKMFTFASNMNVHINRMHENTGERKFKCYICNAKFMCNSSLKRHLSGHVNLRNYKCDVCDSRFNTYKHLKRHMKNLHNLILPSQKTGRKRKEYDTTFEDPASSVPFSIFLQNNV